jgi:membrane protein required for colicin V production
VNPFDAVVAALAILAIVMGFSSGLLRSLASMLGYLAAAPLALAITSAMTGATTGSAAKFVLPSGQTWLLLSIVFVAVGTGVSALLRLLVAEFTGSRPSPLDRAAGATLGALRILLVAVLVVVVFDRVIPADLQPAWLTGSRLRPYLSAAGREGLQSLPAEVEDYIDRLKRERGL